MWPSPDTEPLGDTANSDSTALTREISQMVAPLQLGAVISLKLFPMGRLLQQQWGQDPFNVPAVPELLGTVQRQGLSCQSSPRESLVWEGL